MADGGGSPDIFTKPVTRANPLRQILDQDVLTYPNDERDHAQNLYDPVSTPPLLSFYEYVKRYPDRFDAMWS